MLRRRVSSCSFHLIGNFIDTFHNYLIFLLPFFIGNDKKKKTDARDAAERRVRLPANSSEWQVGAARLVPDRRQPPLALPPSPTGAQSAPSPFARDTDGRET